MSFCKTSLLFCADTDSPQLSSVRSTIVDIDDQEFTRPAPSNILIK